MSKPAAGVAIVLVALAALVGLWVTLDSNGDSDGSERHSVGSGGPEVPGTSTVPVTASTRHTPGSEAESELLEFPQRNAAREWASRYRVVDATGEPVPHAVISWSEVPDEPRPPGGAVDWADLRARTRFTETMEDGTFEPRLLSIDPAEVTGGVLWLTSLGHEAVRISLPDVHDPKGVPARIELQGAALVHASVRTRSGTSPAGARVLQRLSSRELEQQDLSDREWWERRLLFRDWTVAGTDELALPSLGGEMLLHAESENQRSETWSGRGPAACTLLMGATFTARGVVRAESGEPVRGGRVEVLHALGVLRTMIERIRVSEQGEWGPAPLPLEPRGAYHFVFRSDEWAPSEAVLPPPEADSRVEISLVAAPGIDLTILVLDREGPVANALVSGHWQREGLWTQSEGRSSADGRVALGRIPAGTLHLRANADGYVERLVGPLDFHADPGGAYPIVLEPAGTFRLLCIRGGLPVADYDVHFWSDDPDAHDLEAVRGSTDGRCRIRRAPLGRMMLLVSSVDGTQSRPLEVEIRAEHEEELEIELPGPLAGRGTVLDALTANPIPGARIQAYTTYQNLRIAPRGPAVDSHSDGSFVLTSLQAGDNTLYISATGYEPATVSVHGVEGQDLECGIVPLSALGSLVLELGGDPGLDPTGYRVSLHGTEVSSERAFDADGRVHYEQAERTLNSIHLRAQDGPTTIFSVHGMDLRGKLLALEATRQPSFVVKLVDLSADARTEELEVGVLYRRSDGVQVSHFQSVPPSGRVEMRCRPGRFFTLAAVREGRYLASKQVLLEGEADGEFELELSEHLVEFRVTDARGSPVPGASVWIAEAGDSTGWFVRLTTGADGECRGKGLGVGSRVLTVSSDDGCVRSGIRIELEGRGTEQVELELECRAVFHARLVDGVLPVSGASVRLREASEAVMDLALLFSDASGVVRREGLGEGNYRISVAAPGYWPAIVERPVTEDGVVQEIQVRRLGSLELELRRSGAALAGARIELWSEELGEGVAAWIASAAVRSSTGELRTDGQGRLRLDGLPRGSYRWSVDLGSDGARSGTLAVPPAAVGEARLELL